MLVKMNSIVLLNLKETFGHYVFHKQRSHFMPLSLLAMIRLIPQNYHIKIIDQQFHQHWEPDLVHELKKNPLCVGITCPSQLYLPQVIHISQFIKKYSTTKIVVGGTATSFVDPKYFLDYGVDFVVKGEGELTFYELIKSFEGKIPLSKIKGICYKTGSKIKINPQRPFINLEKLPLFDYSLLDLKAYHNAISFETSRGCNMKCSFCHNLIRPGWRGLSSDKTVKWIEEISEKYEASELKIVDDNFTSDIYRFKRILKGVIQKKVAIPWWSQVGDDLIKNCDKEMISLLEKSKCKRISYGLQTGSPRLRTNVDRYIPLKDVFKFNRKLKKTNIKIKYTPIMCLPGETEQDLKLTLKTIFKLKKENPNAEIWFLGLFLPLPGTKAYSEIVQRGYQPHSTVKDFSRRYKTYLPIFSKVSNIPEKRLKFIYLLSHFFWPTEEIKLKDFPMLLLKTYKPIAMYRLKKQFFDKNMLECYFLEKGIDLLLKKEKSKLNDLFTK